MVAKELPSMTILNLALFACFFCLILALETQSQSCHPNDLSSLKEFSGNLTKGSIILTWTNELNCCNWDGVVCGHFSRVIMLNVSRKGLQGSISGSLSNLDQLRLLDLSYNDLKGGLPTDFSNLQLLEVLDLSHNMLSGSIVGALDKLTLVQSLNLSSNLFSGNFSGIGKFPDLVEFVISNNSFSGKLDSQLCSVSRKIRVLDISLNHFTLGLEGLDNCSISLQQLHLDENSLTGLLPESMYSMTSLAQLSVSANYFSGQLSPQLSKLSNLKSLVLSGNMFSGAIPDVFGNLTNLEQFSANSNSFSGALPSSLAQCSKLRVLDLRNNSLSGVINLDFTGLPNLYTLDLAGNRFHGPLPDSLCTSQELRILNLARNKLTGQVPGSYANLTSLMFLSLSNNSLTSLSGVVSVLQNSRSLTTLILSMNFYGENIPTNVGGFNNLMVFSLGYCGLNGQIPSWLFNCSKLEILDLSWNHLNGSIPPGIGKMDSLFYLDLSNNSLTGEIPKSLTELNALTITKKNSPSSLNSSTVTPLFVYRDRSSNHLQYNQASSFPPSIHLSNNKLNGTIWPEIGRLKELHVLDLSRNNVTGTIPPSISHMRNLEILDLSFNNLHGYIPQSFNMLTFLSKFSVAYNQLHGEIPTGSQFFTFPSSSFEGNPGLCGKVVHPCVAVNNTGLQPVFSGSSSNKKFGQSSFLGSTISLGVEITILLDVVLFM